MPTLRFETTVAKPIGYVWDRFQNVRELLPALTPTSQGLVIEQVEHEPPQLGTIVHLSMRSPIGRMRWQAKYVEFRPPHATITGIEARFVDEQIAGPFKRWTQSHEFEAADDRTTRCIDVIDYALPLGLLGSIADVVAVRWMICRMFAHRQARMRELFV